MDDVESLVCSLWSVVDILGWFLNFVCEIWRVRDSRLIVDRRVEREVIRVGLVSILEFVRVEGSMNIIYGLNVGYILRVLV